MEIDFCRRVYFKCAIQTDRELHCRSEIQIRFNVRLDYLTID